MFAAILVSQFTAQAASAAEELVGPPELAEELPPEFERLPPVEHGSPLTLMQWSYGDGADCVDFSKPLESDRPYFTKSASVVGIGVWQLETGYTYARESEGQRDNTFHSLPEANLRIGAIAEWLEFRAGWTYIDHNTDSNARDMTGSSDPYVGMKIALTPQDEMLPETAVLIDTNVPTSLDRNVMDPGADLIYRWRLNDKWSMGGSSEFRRIATRERTATVGFAQSWIFERSFDERLTGFAEWAMFSVDARPNPQSNQYLDFGLLYFVTDNVQLDTSVGYGLNQEAMDYFCGFGVTDRR
jgi:hypothetical protein